MDRIIAFDFVADRFTPLDIIKLDGITFAHINLLPLDKETSAHQTAR